MAIPPSGSAWVTADYSTRPPPALHDDPAVDVDRLPGEEPGLRRGEVERRVRHVRRAAPAAQRRRLRDRTVELAIGLFGETGLDPPGAEHVDAHLRRQAAREALAERQDPALDGGEQLRVIAGHACRHVVPAHVDDRPTALLPAHDLARRVRAGDRALEVD